MSDREHPTSALLLRFVHSQATKEENREIVRHLLTRCPECLAALKSCKALPWLVWSGERRQPTRLRRGRRIRRRLRRKKGSETMFEIDLGYQEI